MIDDTVLQLLRPKTAPQVASVAPDATVTYAVCLMNHNDIGAVLVMRDGRLDGILTERDVLRRVIEPGFGFVAFAYFEYQGFRKLGIRGYLGKYFVFSAAATCAFAAIIVLLFHFFPARAPGPLTAKAAPVNAPGVAAPGRLVREVGAACHQQCVATNSGERTGEADRIRQRRQLMPIQERRRRIARRSAAYCEE